MRSDFALAVVLISTLMGTLHEVHASASSSSSSSSGKARCPLDSDKAGKLPSASEDLEFCHSFAKRTCCGAPTTRRIATNVVGLTQRQYGDETLDGSSSSSSSTCKELWASLVCAPCDPRVAIADAPSTSAEEQEDNEEGEDGDGGGGGEESGGGSGESGDGRVDVCKGLCTSVYFACAQEYFTGDANNLPMPCRDRDVVCTRLEDWFQSGDELCSALHFNAVDSDRCYPGTRESPWDALIRAREKKRAKARRKASTSRTSSAQSTKARRPSMYRRIVTIVGQSIAIAMVAAGALAAAYYRMLLTRRRRAAVIPPSSELLADAAERRLIAEAGGDGAADTDGTDDGSGESGDDDDDDDDDAHVNTKDDDDATGATGVKEKTL